MRRVKLLAVIATLAVAIGLMGPAAVAAQEPPEGETYDLGFRWTTITWAGPDGISPDEALNGTGAGEGGDDVSDIVTALYTHDGEGWLAYFPAAVGIPGVNQIESLRRGAGYWVAINVEGGVEWTIAPGPIEEIRLGALLSITGAGSSLGAVSAAALEIAVDEWNQMLKDEDSEFRIVLDIEDTAQNAANAEVAVTALLDRGARIIVGPQSSGELSAIGDMIDDAGAILVSHGSTASTLSGLFDNVFRFVPTDVAEGEAIVDLMVHHGAETIIPVHRNDTGNAGLAMSVANFGALAEVTVEDALVYETDAEDYDTLLADLLAAVDAASTDVGAENVAVYLAGFEEVADILAAAGDGIVYLTHEP